MVLCSQTSVWSNFGKCIWSFTYGMMSERDADSGERRVPC